MSKTNLLKRREWANKINSWRQSGKSARAWCKENRVTYTTFLGWCKRLKPQTNVDNPLNPLKSQFIELKSEPEVSHGISLEYDGVLIHLKEEFNTSLLKRCLAVLRGGPC